MTLHPAIPALLLLATLGAAASGAMPDWWRGDPLDSDGWEAANRPWADPAVFDADSDLDGDGLSLWHEWYFGSNPGNPDSNGDGRTGGEVFEAGGNPALDPAGDEAYGAVGFTPELTLAANAAPAAGGSALEGFAPYNIHNRYTAVLADVETARKEAAEKEAKPAEAQP